MIDFWICAGLLLSLALVFLLLPIVRGRRAQAEEDRTALNVALYQERLAELEAQRAGGTLSEAQWQDGRADAARELLGDTEQSVARPIARLGKTAPLLAALLVPVLGLGLYLHWGASDRLQLARQFAEQPRTVEEMLARLESAVKVQPDSAEAWYFLGRAYMSQERAADAVPAFARTVELAGRQPQLLGQWAQAQYFAGERKWTPQLQALADETLQGDPAEVTILGLLGIAAYEERRYADAVDFWQRLVAVLPADDPSRSAIEGGIARAREELGEPPQATAAVAALRFQVQVSLAESLRDEVLPGDSLFVFARAAQGPAIPLAAKRLSAAELPVSLTLGDEDAMMPQLKLSNFEEIRLVARISRKGDAMRGEWIGQGETLKTADAAGKTFTLLIDQPEAQ
ncbi:c-type cytochrome biogenesis protein CcmI [Stutzerimonas kirkiae]|uniref:C-type cytochrome biogenesis protein CcmI n=1 Tax=Stutzerimonas kirkiae TaxID=2211392 RepID=A0A4Q9RBI1_9GAMM|nr:c-type cytochrome biogenesis protein CcmI [Stutzerimonas kirkiae]TBU98262.1 c-type cytochrome biogenesis protein CcmI [Stutzerimonas kirkiae]TBV00936.1 c-type cytochrome biogenesis protein CcmI [Stutzerimonas kirkiae]TBV07761.1 c-type cytochrome biogenesis protein CcmI [Stutzerimonas kirkiae]TBV16282.1 c-type cytochrome biogenesis protein CcmI [Stutzerimonas kirkiae]